MFVTPPTKAKSSPVAVQEKTMRAGPSNITAVESAPGQVRRSIGKLEVKTKSPPKPTIYTSRTKEARAIWVHAKSQLDQSGNIKTSIKIDVNAALKSLYEIVKGLEATPAVSRPQGESGDREKKSEWVDVAPADKGNEILEGIMEVKDILRKEAEKSMEELKELRKEAERNMEELRGTRKAVEDAGNRLSSQITYAQVAAAAPFPELAQRKAMHSIIVSSSDVQDTSDTVLEKIRTTVQARESGVRVERVRKARNQAVVVTCQEKEEMEKIVKRLKDAKTDLKIEEARNKKPMVVVMDVLQHLTDDDLMKAIVKQNGRILDGIKIEEEDMKVKFRRRARNPLTAHVVLEVAPIIWRQLTAAGRIHVDLQRVVVQDQSPLIQCTKCLGYGHGRRFCKEPEDLCSHCGGPHLRAACEAFLVNEKPECRNCKHAKKDRTDHNAFDKTCSIRRKWDEVARSAVAYC